jgi:hypothetical protein
MNETETAISAALAQTGFPFEHHIFQEATAAGWTTIPNRLYVDAEEDKTREMDLLCYRADKAGEATVYTALLISCKARTDKPWVLMTRPWAKPLPAWYPYPPVPTWTNSQALLHELTLPNWALSYFNEAAAAGLTGWAEDSREEVFALQELELAKKGNGEKLAPTRFRTINDTSLYTGAMSLLKALAYELGSLNERRAKESEALAYQFNLIQMLDGDLYEASFGQTQPQVRPVDRYRYFARTMLNGKELSARIDFCTRRALAGLLDDMGRLHRFNLTHFNQKKKAFFNEALNSPSRLAALRPSLEARLVENLAITDPSIKPDAPGWLTLEYRQAESLLVLQVDAFTMDEDRLNKNDSLLRTASRAVRDLYRYSGPVKFESDIPF